MTTSSLALTQHFSGLANRYDVILSDVWGVIHNGLESFPAACDALARFRAKGGKVILITNAPRPAEAVIKQINKLGVPAGAYDGIVSSGDVTRAAIRARPGQTLFHIGPDRDYSIFSGLGVRFDSLENADYVVCSGLFNDEAETPEDYRVRLKAMKARRQFMVCGNPDVVVERGDRLVYCAGAIADLYKSLGGEVLYAGKPHKPIYDMALEQARAAGATITPGRVLAIGDSIRTDMTGAKNFGVDFLFMTAGIHAEELGDRDNPDMARLEKLFAAAGCPASMVMQRLAW